MKTQKYAQVSWTANDLQTLAPKVSLEKLEVWLELNQRKIQEKIISVGWDIISCLLASDGVDTSDEDEDEDFA